MNISIISLVNTVQDDLRNEDLHDQFTILKKCRQKMNRLIYEMLFMKNKKKKKQH